MPVNVVNRTRIVFDLIKDGDVVTPADYASLEMLGAPAMLKYADSFWAAYGTQLYEAESDVDGNPVPRDPTNPEKSTLVINQLRKYIRDVHRANRVQNAVTPVRASETSTVDTEMNTEIGTEEV